MTSNSNTSTPQIAVWYFVGATFVFAAPALFFPEAPLWVRIACFALGVLVVVGGGLQLSREIRQRRDDRNAQQDHDTGAR